MAIARGCEVVCDSVYDKECLLVHRGGKSTAALARKAARKDGWVRHKGKDYCPPCARAVGLHEAS